MIEKYFKLVRIVLKRQAKCFNIKTETVSAMMFAYIASFITPILILLKFSANFVTGFNFIISITSILCIVSLDNNLFCFGILLFFIFRVLDMSDGIIARHNNLATFYGRFLDSILDIFYEPFLIISISYFVFNLYEDKNILLVGYLGSVFATFSTCVHDKYGSLARWCNEENKTKIEPYIRRNVVPRLGYVLLDLIAILILIMPFFIRNVLLMDKFFFIFIFIILLNSIQNIIKHIFSAKKNFNNIAKDKTFYDR